MRMLSISFLPFLAYFDSLLKRNTDPRPIESLSALSLPVSVGLGLLGISRDLGIPIQNGLTGDNTSGLRFRLEMGKDNDTGFRMVEGLDEGDPGVQESGAGC